MKKGGLPNVAYLAIGIAILVPKVSLIREGLVSTKFLIKWFLIYKIKHVFAEFIKYKMYMQRNLLISLFVKYFQLRLKLKIPNFVSSYF